MPAVVSVGEQVSNDILDLRLRLEKLECEVLWLRNAANIHDLYNRYGNSRPGETVMAPDGRTLAS